jgi:hypothetical protein
MAEKEKKKMLNISGNYNHDKEGVITEEFLDQVIKSAINEAKKKEAKYLTIKGYYNLKESMSLQQILNFMHSREYKFKEFIFQDRNIQAEMLFEHE